MFFMSKDELNKLIKEKILEYDASVHKEINDCKGKCIALGNRINRLEAVNDIKKYKELDNIEYDMTLCNSCIHR